MAVKSIIKAVPGVKTSIKYLKRRRKLNTKIKFDDRSTHSNKLCILLAGYKPFTWEKVIPRLKKFIPNDVDVCIGSSGLFSPRLSKIAEENDWSYLSTSKNNVSILQNVIINTFPDANLIFKIDEDIFLTDGVFESLENTMVKLTKPNSSVVPGFVAPLIPINGYGYRRILKKTGLLSDYESKFGIAKLAAGPDQQIESNPEVAKFFWGAGDSPIPGIDELAFKFKKSELDYSICPIRFSIGCIMFTRSTWLDMGMFDPGVGAGMGVDEVTIDSYCVIDSKPMVIDERCVVGHLSFGKQNQTMETFFKNHQNEMVPSV